MAIINANLSNVKASGNFEPLPPGEYQVKIVDSDVVTTKSGKPMLKVEMTVEDNGASGFSAHLIGRKIWEQFVLENEIARSRLKGMASAAGHPHPDMIRDSEELHGLRLGIRVKIENDEQFGPRNKITTFKPIAFQSSPVPAQAAVPPMTAPAVPGQPAPTTPALPAIPPAAMPQASAAPVMPWSK